MRQVHSLHFLTIIVLSSLFLLMGCQTAAQETTLNHWLPPDSPALINFPMTVTSQRYTFAGDSQRSLQLILSPLTPDLPYVAELRDSQGSMLASVGGAATFQNAVFTLSPSSAVYEMIIKSPGANRQGTLQIQVGGVGSTVTNPFPVSDLRAIPTLAAFQLPLDALSAQPKQDAACTVSSTTNVNIRSGPGLDFTVISSLPPSTPLVVEAQSTNGWFQASGSTGWVSGSVVTASGNCITLPLVNPPAPQPTAVPTAMYQAMALDNGLFRLEVDHNGWGELRERLAVSERDMIQVAVTSLGANEYREYIITLQCNGSGTEMIRWGAPEQPTLVCAESYRMPTTGGAAEMWFAVQANEFVTAEYTLSVTVQQP
jgi:hypothetical protein